MFKTLRISVLAAALIASGGVLAGVITTDPNLPPTVGSYRTPANVHAEFMGPMLDIVLSDVSHFGFLNVIRMPIVPMSPDELETFDSTVTGIVTVNAGMPFPVMLMGSVMTEVFGKIGNPTGTFQTEMLQLNLTGGGIMVRESPTLASVGVTTITDIGGGQFRIDSFFDVFTELSLDNGMTWLPSTDSARVQLVPEPASLALLALGLGLLGLRGSGRKAPA